jgi:D-sedoheptulose 7-phosphate isomerase
MKETDIVKTRLKESARLKEKIAVDADMIVRAADAISSAFRAGHKVLLFGNGGSAADAQHIAAELEGRFKKDRRPLPAIALTTNTSSLTAIGNDYDFDDVFSRLVKAHAREGDVVIGISTSGSSENVLRAIKAANELNAFSIALCGEGGKLKSLADLALVVPSRDTPRIQEVHITLGHIICELVEEKLFGGR